VTNLFEDAWSGRQLIVSMETHELLAELFPEVDRPSTYRDADSWLVTCSPSRRPRNVKRFLLNWFRRAKRFEAGNQYVTEDGVRCKVTQADYKTGRILRTQS
jgi:hypothetical protein